MPPAIIICIASFCFCVDIPTASFRNHYYRPELIHRGLTVSTRWQQQQHQYHCGGRLNRANEVDSSFFSSVKSLPNTLTETYLKPLDDHFHQQNPFHPRSFTGHATSFVNQSNPTSSGSGHHNLDRSSSKDTSSAAASLPGSEDETTEADLELATCYCPDDNEVTKIEHDLQNDVIDTASSSVVPVGGS